MFTGNSGSKIVRSAALTRSSSGVSAGRSGIATGFGSGRSPMTGRPTRFSSMRFPLLSGEFRRVLPDALQHRLEAVAAVHAQVLVEAQFGEVALDVERQNVRRLLA